MQEKIAMANREQKSSREKKKPKASKAAAPAPKPSSYSEPQLIRKTRQPK
jgi:hypothetical protein